MVDMVIFCRTFTSLLIWAAACTSNQAQFRILLAQIAPQSSGGSFVRAPPTFLSVDTANLPAVTDLCVYLGNPCPWCHRVAIALVLLDLQQSVRCRTLAADAQGASRGGWVLCEEDGSQTARCLSEVYSLYAPNYKGKATAPLLLDTRLGKILSNDSQDIIRILHRMWMSRRAFANAPEGSHAVIHESGLYGSGAEEVKEIESYSAWLYQNLNNGVYRAGFATSQQDPILRTNTAYSGYSAALVSIDQRLQDSKYLHGSCVTISDIFLLPTVERFDAIYSCLFRCNGVRIAECDNIRRWRRDMRSLSGVRDTFDLENAAKGYYTQLFPLNPSGITPILPRWQLEET